MATFSRIKRLTRYTIHKLAPGQYSIHRDYVPLAERSKRHAFALGVTSAFDPTGTKAFGPKKPYSGRLALLKDMDRLSKDRQVATGEIGTTALPIRRGLSEQAIDEIRSMAVGDRISVFVDHNGNFKKRRRLVSPYQKPAIANNESIRDQDVKGPAKKTKA